MLLASKKEVLSFITITIRIKGLAISDRKMGRYSCVKITFSKPLQDRLSKAILKSNVYINKTYLVLAVTVCFT
jgi:hypothetical protein